jgi:Spy/CpxP family protein refolding chaperone
MRKTTTVAGGFLAVLMSLQLLCAQDDPGPAGPEGPGMGTGRQRGHRGMMARGGMQQALIKRILDNPEIAEQVGLTEEQISTLKQAMFEIEKKLIDLHAEQAKAGMEQGQLLDQDQIDKKAVMKAVEKTGEISTEIAKLQMEQLLLVKETLTTEQIDKIKEMIHEHARQRRDETRNRWEERRRNRGARRGRGTDTETDEDAGPDEE